MHEKKHKTFKKNTTPLKKKKPNLLQKKNAKTLCTETQNNLHKNTKLIAPPKKKNKTHCKKKHCKQKKHKTHCKKKPSSLPPPQKKKNIAKKLFFLKKKKFAKKRKYKNHRQEKKIAEKTKPLKKTL